MENARKKILVEKPEILGRISEQIRGGLGGLLEGILITTLEVTHKEIPKLINPKRHFLRNPRRFPFLIDLRFLPGSSSEVL